MHTHVYIFHIHTVNRKSSCEKKLEFNIFVLKEFHESLTLRLLHASIFNRFQLSTHACVLSRVMGNEMLSGVLVLGGIIFLLLVYGITNSTVFGIPWHLIKQVDESLSNVNG